MNTNKFTVEGWLDSTVKNEYYHVSLIESDKEYNEGWNAAYKALNLQMSQKWTREEYLSWVKNWKAVYAKLTAESRWSKIYRSSNAVKEKTGMSNNTLSAISIANANLLHFYSLRSIANHFLDLRAEGKELAEVAYLASHPEKELMHA